MGTIPREQEIHAVGHRNSNVHCIHCGTLRQWDVVDQCLGQFNCLVAWVKQRQSLQEFEPARGRFLIASARLIDH